MSTKCRGTTKHGYKGVPLRKDQSLAAVCKNGNMLCVAGCLPSTHQQVWKSLAEAHPETKDIDEVCIGYLSKQGVKEVEHQNVFVYMLCPCELVHTGVYAP